MKIEDFVARMNSIIVSVKDINKEIYSLDLLENWFNSYRITARNVPKDDISLFQDPIKELHTHYDCSRVEIGAITFEQHLEEDDKYCYFGSLGGDQLAVNKFTHQVELRESNANHTISFCAKDTISFLCALLIAAEFIASSPFDEDISENPQVCQTAVNCAKEAGGHLYSSFYCMLLGCYE